METTVYRFEAEGRSCVLHIAPTSFDRDCILYVADTYIHSYFIHISPSPENGAEITLIARDHGSIPEDLPLQFFNDCIDQQIRLMLQKEFGELRQTIVDYAFRPVEKLCA